MKRFSLLLALVALLPSVALADVPVLKDPKVDAWISAALPRCATPKEIRWQPLDILGDKIRTAGVLVESDDPICSGSFLVAVTPGNRIFFGQPWVLTSYSGSLEQKLRAFAWEQMRVSARPVVAEKPDADGLLAVEINEVTDYGEIPVRGFADREGKVFLPGTLHPLATDPKAALLSGLGSVIEKAPATGPKDAKVTVVEFSDFQCPSCKRSAKFVDPLIEELGSRIRYVRVDLPMISGHPWAFPAAARGRAIYTQNPAAFWAYKSEIYANQSELNLFAIGDFARAFAKEQGLDVSQLDSLAASDALKREILEGVGAAYSAGILGTPTFVVNGQFVSAGVDGGNLRKVILEYLDGAKN